MGARCDQPESDPLRDDQLVDVLTADLAPVAVAPTASSLTAPTAVLRDNPQFQGKFLWMSEVEEAPAKGRRRKTATPSRTSSATLSGSLMSPETI